MMKWMKMEILILIMLTALMGCKKSTEQQIAEQMSLGQKYLEEANYEEAIVMFNKVIEIDPLMAEAYVGIAQCYENQSDFETALNILDEGVQVIGRDILPEETIERIAEIYSRLSEWFSQQGNIDLVLRCYSSIIQIQPDNEEVKEKKNEIQIIQEKRPLLEEMAHSIVGKNTYDFQDMEILSEDFQALIAGVEKPVIFAVEDGLYLGVYPGGYIYYGEMEDGKRSGNGYWCYGDIRQFTKIRCEWEEDVPNGSAVKELYRNLAEIIREEAHVIQYTESGRTERGIYVGIWEESWIMENGEEHKWKVSYIDGQAQAIEVDESGVKIHAYCEICGDGLTVSDNIHQINGI